MVSANAIPATAPRFLAVDFYCGAGGTTRGLLDAGGYVIAGVDKDAACQDTYQRNNPNLTLDRRLPGFLDLDMFPASPDYPGGQQEQVIDELLRLIPRYRALAPDAPLLFTICAPCQAFTKFKQRNLTAERTSGREKDQHLLAQTLGLIEKFEPEMILSENVANIKRGKNVQFWQEFRDNLRSIGYRIGETEVCASNFGVPQRRHRSILMAVKSDNMEWPILVPNRDSDAPVVSVQEAIGHLPSLEAGKTHPDIPNHTCRGLSDLNRQRLMSVRPGESNVRFSETPYGDLTLACHRRMEGDGNRGFGDVYTRMAPDRPAPTITTRFHSISNGRFGHYDEKQVRGLTLREGAVLQSFLDGYYFYANGLDKAAVMIGNAVPPRVAKFMTDWLVNQWAEERAQ